MSKHKRYYVRASDDAGSLPDAPRDRTWDVVDRETDTIIHSSFYTRKKARAYAQSLNDRKP